MPSLTGLLSHVPMYVGLQKAVGADTLRYRCLDAAPLRPGEVVVDVGRGPANYLERLPQPLTRHRPHTRCLRADDLRAPRESTDTDRGTADDTVT